METSRLDGETETRIAPDWAVVYGDSKSLKFVSDIDECIIAWGDTKLKRPSTDDMDAIPDTIACKEAHLAQVVQYCIDLGIPFGFVLTNNELIVVHLIKEDAVPEHQMVTRSSRLSSGQLQFLPSDATEEADYSSPMRRGTRDWIEFDEGDDAIPLLMCEGSGPESPLGRISATEYGRDESFSPSSHQEPRAPLFQARELRYTTPDLPSSPPRFIHQDTSPGFPNTPSRGNRVPVASPGSSPSEPQSESSSYHTEPRAEDPTHVLIKAYPADDEGVAQRLFELCMLAKTAKDHSVLRIGPQKLSFASFHTLNM
ncbi:hypothetical protein F4861DRAFT_436592 [Xylaria intraflava]|nr:hypothetical protein F4861DRAFT_436592 [Xylaria intraflava]